MKKRLELKFFMFLFFFYLIFDSNIAFGLCSQTWEMEMTSELSKQKSIPLICSDQIARAAQYHADDMCRRNYFSHISPEGYTAQERLKQAGVTFYYWAENLYRTTQPEPTTIISAWMQHSDYRRIITDPRLKSVGFGLVNCQGWYLIVADYTD